MIMSMCIFGAVALGPGDRRPAGRGRRLAAAVLDRRRGLGWRRCVLALLTFEDAPPADPQLAAGPARASALAAVGCVAAFFGASQLPTHAFLDPIAIMPLLGGLAVIVMLIVYQYRRQRPLLTIRDDAHEHDPRRRAS